MGGGSEALLKVWRAPLDLFPESFEYKKKFHSQKKGVITKEKSIVDSRMSPDLPRGTG
jgi:hypothetical protein